MADTSVLVAAPGEAEVGEIVPVTVTVTENGAPVPDAVVTLSRVAAFAGVSGYVEMMRATTDEDGTADLSFVQRAAELTADLRIDVLDSDAEPLDFAVTSVGPREQIHRSDTGVDLPGLGGWVLILLVAGLWALILSTVLRLRNVSVEGADLGAEAELDVDAKPIRRLLPYALSGVVAVVGIVLVTVLFRNPASHANIEGPQSGDRVPHSHLGEATPVVSPGLAPAFAAPTGDPAVDGARNFFGLGCASCHGLDAMSGVVGGDITGEVEDGLGEFLDEVRRGPKGMPTYPVEDFRDEDLALVHAYLEMLLSE